MPGETADSTTDSPRPSPPDPAETPHGDRPPSSVKDIAGEGSCRKMRLSNGNALAECLTSRVEPSDRSGGTP